MRSARLLLAVTLLVVSCPSCSRGSGGTEPDGSPTGSTSTPSASPSVPPYLASYSVEQRHAYDAALAAHSAFVEQDRQFAAVGKTTKQAAAYYRRNSIDWVADWATLAQLANNGVTVTGRTTVKWVRPVSIDLDGLSADVIVLRRCVDSSGLVVSQDGKRLEQPNLKIPHVFRIRLEKRAGETWWRVGTAKPGAPC